MAIPNEVLRTATLGADNVAMSFKGIEADRTRAIIKRALEVLEYNKMITFTDPETWPEWMILDPEIDEMKKSNN